MDITMEQKKQYQKRVEQVCPQTNLLTGCLKAFVVGGLICVLGQMINTWIMNFGCGPAVGSHVDEYLHDLSRILSHGSRMVR